ncbi:RNA polymerase sigma factor [Yinghuangia sp. ASG 101]|uniref:SigE family RNA polymerase sigma factor n=1 Tax=Yinghuangia sp. ASG 101 TaxID=2896848 RepID=UPI001E5B12CA|nr:SigE family RNA polymerase sigma factor [Yinghuangia sp. ASG 101]UGQ14056.1 RNA polymerase sigma factor [Yinghuangia sp. ASG 101]
MKPEQEHAFNEFVTARGAALRRTAYLLCGDWHDAEDLVQTALTKAYAKWHKLRNPDAMHGFVRQVLVRSFVDSVRKRSSRETPSGTLPDTLRGASEDPDTRVVLLAALARVSPAYRAVLVMRFWEDQSIEQTAALLNKNSGAVRSATSRGLDQLRSILGDQVLDLVRG